MRRAYVISLIILALVVGVLARTVPDTAPELMPLSAAVNWIQGNGPIVAQDLLPAGVRPTHVFRIRENYRPRTPPATMLYYGGVCRLYRDSLGRPLDGADLPRLCWILNFFSVLPWAFLLFGGLTRLAVLWGFSEGTKPIWAAWAAMAGSLVFGWLSAASIFLPLAALACWTVVMVLESHNRPAIGPLILGGLCAGFAGAGHPAGWTWAVWGLLMLFVSPPKGVSPARQTVLISTFGISAAVAVVISLIGNAFFFGNPLPVQWIDIQHPEMQLGDMARLIWHDLVGLNGVIWLAPLVVPGVLALAGRKGEDSHRASLRFLLGIASVVLLSWGITDDARMVGETERLLADFRVLPAELVGGEFTMVQLGAAAGTEEEYQAYFEQLIDRTDVFFSMGARPPGVPLFLPAAILLGLFGWCNISSSRFRFTWSWLAVRWGGLIGLIMSQAPYGSAPSAFLYIGTSAGGSRMPIVESILAFALRLAELWPSGVVRF